MMATKYYIKDTREIFSLNEESGFFRLTVGRPDIQEKHVEDFLDTTIEWLSTNPKKGILIDFTGVRSVCGDFTVHLTRHYEDIKARGLNVRFVNVDPAIEPYIDVSNITIVMDLPELPPDKAVLSAKQILSDLGNDLSDEQLMKKHGLSEKGLESMFRKLLRKRLISKRTLAKRMGVSTSQMMLVLEGSGSRKARVDARQVLKDLEIGVSDRELMKKYRLSAKGLKSLMRKLKNRDLVTWDMLVRRNKLLKK
jgi:anti-anti-sigma regulatory factor/Mor family transcriptional regulator